MTSTELARALRDTATWLRDGAAFASEHCTDGEQRPVPLSSGVVPLSIEQARSVADVMETAAAHIEEQLP
jgi:hypothetical protein